MLEISDIRRDDSVSGVASDLVLRDLSFEQDEIIHENTKSHKH